MGVEAFDGAAACMATQPVQLVEADVAEAGSLPPLPTQSTPRSSPTSGRAEARERSFSISERKLLLVASDLLVLVGSSLITFLLEGTVDVLTPRIAVWAFVVATAWVLVARALGCYDLVVAARVRKIVPRILTAAGITLIIYWLIPFWSPLPATRWPIGFEAVLLCGGLVAARTGYALSLGRRAFAMRTLLLGPDAVTTVVARIFQSTSRADYELIGQFEYPSTRPAQEAAAHLVKFVHAERIHQIVLGGSAELAPALQAAIVELAEQGVNIITAAEMYEDLTGQVLLPAVDSLWLATLPGPSGLYTLARRLMEMIVAAVGLLVLALPLLLVALAIVLESPGLPVYSQVRVGRHGRPFKMLKLRTMVREAEAHGGPQWSRPRDPRVTRMGRWLRRTRQDELPQLWNVLRGDMSLIGPRPERPEFTEMLCEQLPLYRVRHIVRPGISGWAQVRYPYGASVNDAARKLQYDLYYIRHRSLTLDGIILCRTASAVIAGQGL